MSDLTQFNTAKNPYTTFVLMCRIEKTAFFSVVNSSDVNLAFNR